MALPSAMRSGQKATSIGLPRDGDRRSTRAVVPGIHRRAQDEQLAVAQMITELADRLGTRRWDRD